MTVLTFCSNRIAYDWIVVIICICHPLKCIQQLIKLSVIELEVYMQELGSLLYGLCFIAHARGMVVTINGSNQAGSNVS